MGRTDLCYFRSNFMKIDQTNKDTVSALTQMENKSC